MTDVALTPGELEVLIDGLSGYISLDWALIHLGLRGNPPSEAGPPSQTVLTAAFVSFERLVASGCARIGRMEPVPGAQPGARGGIHYELIEEPLAVVRARVEASCASARPTDLAAWEYSCWLENTERGDATARSALAADR